MDILPIIPRDSMSDTNGAVHGQEYTSSLLTSIPLPPDEPISMSKLAPCSKKWYQLTRERSIYERFKVTVTSSSIGNGDFLPIVGQIVEFRNADPLSNVLNQSDLSTVQELSEQDNPCTDCWW